MTRVWWVRHGPTHAQEMIGWTDRPADLSDTAALARLRAFLPAAAPILSSDLRRAVDTAAAIDATRCGTRVAAFRELHFGDWEELRFAEAEARDPGHIRRFWDEPGEVAAPGGESWADLQERVNAAVDDVLAQAGPEIIVVAHFGVILTQIERALAIPTREAFAQKIDPLSVTCIDCTDDGWRLVMANRLP